MATFNVRAIVDAVCTEMGVQDENDDLRENLDRVVREHCGDACLAKAQEDEPIFVLLGRDPIAHMVVLDWALTAERLGLHADKTAEARDQAHHMEAWRKPSASYDEALAQAVREGLMEVSSEGDARQYRLTEKGRALADGMGPL